MIKIPKITEEDLRRASARYYLDSKNNKTCISYWYPRIKENLPNISMPDTVMVYTNMDERMDWACDYKGAEDSLLRSIALLQSAADKMGYPCFMKDGVFSGKHGWLKTCFIQRKGDIPGNLRELTEFQAGVGCMFSHFVCIRKFITTAAPFMSHNGMPVTRERRYFVKDGKVYFHHPYWPPFAIVDPTSNNWESELAALNIESSEEVAHLTAMTEHVGSLLGDDWSVDWLMDTGGQWHLTDMALANNSFKWHDYTP